MEQPDPGGELPLSLCPAFAGLPEDLRELVASRMRMQTFAPGETLIRQGDVGDSLMVLLRGSASVRVTGTDAAARHVAKFGPGDVMGEMALVTRERRSADVVADTPVDVLRLAASDFDEIAEENPELGVVLSHVVAERLGGTVIDGMSGKQVDRCRIVRCVGRGAMAVVYEALDDESGERVALKMMSHRLLYDHGAMARFQREADVLGSIRHPHVARMLRRFRAYRTQFLVMEFCDGGSLEDLIRARGGLPDAEARRIVGQLASALIDMHTRGLVHRDLKPGNAMLTSAGVVKLADFGLARAVSPHRIDTVTTERTVVGTPYYMPPEQMFGDAAGPGADVYALACVAHELATGRPPFRATAFFALVEEKRRFVLAPDEAAAAGLSGPMREFVARALAPEPSHRVVDLAAVAAWAAPGRGDGP